MTVHDIVVSVGNILDSTDVRWTGALEPPDFVFPKCRELDDRYPTAFFCRVGNTSGIPAPNAGKTNPNNTEIHARVILDV